MIIAKRNVNPYLASRNGETTYWTIVFEGTKAECEAYLLDEYNSHGDWWADSLKEALKKSEEDYSYDGISYDRCYKGYRLDHDSRIWVITTKKALKD